MVGCIVGALSGTEALTLIELYRRSEPHPWLEFLKALEYLVSDGLVEADEDGVAVRFALTGRGREVLAPSSPVREVRGPFRPRSSSRAGLEDSRATR